MRSASLQYATALADIALEQGAAEPVKKQLAEFGAAYADGVTDIMFGGAILPSLLHQDPRYFYQGTGTVKSRMRIAYQRVRTALAELK